MFDPHEVFPKGLSKALWSLGQYVYAYYEPNTHQPFYVGKGSKNRVLDHWKKAIKDPIKEHELRISEILKRGEYPQIKFLAYNLDESKEPRYSIAERVLQDAFGIQSVWSKAGGVERLTEIPSFLLQRREEQSRLPTLSIDAAIAKADIAKEYCREDLESIAFELNAPILVVGLSKTYHSTYQVEQLAEMARMHWKLGRFKNLSELLSKDGILLAWTSKLNKRPTIVGVWKIIKGNAVLDSKTKRYQFSVETDNYLRKTFLGCRLSGTGQEWQGPKIYTRKDK